MNILRKLFARPTPERSSVSMTAEEVVGASKSYEELTVAIVDFVRKTIGQYTAEERHPAFLIGYVHGCAEAAARAVGLAPSEEVGVILAVFTKSFGKENGAQMWSSSNSFASGNASEFKADWTSGLHAGRAAAAANLGKKETGL